MSKICHIISAFKRFDTRIFWKQCLSLKEEGHDVTIITSDGLPDDEKNGIKIYASGFRSNNRLKRIICSKKYAYRKALEINADCYQIHDPEMIKVGIKLLKKGAYVFYDAHEDFPRQILQKEWIPRLFRKPMSCWAEKFLQKNLSKYTGIFTVTDYLTELMKKISNNVYEVTNFPIVDTNYQQASFEEFVSRGNVFCYAGNINQEWKNETIIEALFQVNGKLIFAGQPSNEYLAKLSSLEGWRNVDYRGYVQRQEVDAIYKNALCGLAIIDYVPNVNYKRGTLGINKLFEFMSAGIPFVATDLLVWKNIVDKYHCGILVDPNDKEAILKAMKFMIENKEEAYQMGLNGRKAAESEYNWQSQRSTYIGAYNKVLK